VTALGQVLVQQPVAVVVLTETLVIFLPLVVQVEAVEELVALQD
jgi:hypothetical protein